MATLCSRAAAVAAMQTSSPVQGRVVAAAALWQAFCAGCPCMTQLQQQLLLPAQAAAVAAAQMLSAAAAAQFTLSWPACSTMQRMQPSSGQLILQLCSPLPGRAQRRQQQEKMAEQKEEEEEEETVEEEQRGQLQRQLRCQHLLLPWQLQASLCR